MKVLRGASRLVVAVLTLWVVVAWGDPRGRLAGIDSSSRFVVYYGRDLSPATMDRLGAADIVVIDANISTVTPAIVASLQNRGVDYVLCYLSVGEDTEPIPFTGDGLGPVYHNGTEVVTTEGGIASFYLDQYWDGYQYATDGQPDQNPTWGGYFIYPNADWRWVLRHQRIGGSPEVPSRDRVGLEQIAGSRVSDTDTNRANNFGFDGFFLDTIGTAGPYKNTPGDYPWAASEMATTVRYIGDQYLGKAVVANRGLFYYIPGLWNNDFDVRHYEHSIRPYVNAVVFEGYHLNSDASNPLPSSSFDQHKHTFAPKINAEANRSDGFTPLALNYEENRDPFLFDQAFEESTIIQGWAGYLAEDGNLKTIGSYYETHPVPVDVDPPVWDSTASAEWSHQDSPDRVGIQSLALGAEMGEVVISWDVARDQSLPIRYHVYQSTDPSFVEPIVYFDVDCGVGRDYAWDPDDGAANETNLQGLEPGTYYFRVRAQDSSPAGNIDSNDVTLVITIPGAPDPNAVTDAYNPYSLIVVDGNPSEWNLLRPYVADPVDITGAQNPLDWIGASMAHDSERLYLMYQSRNPISLTWGHNVFLDTDADSATGFSGFGGSLPVGGDFLLQSRYLFQYTGSGTDWSWVYVRGVDYGVQDTAAEFAIPRVSLPGIGSRLRLFLQGDNVASPGGDQTDYYPDLPVNGPGVPLAYHFALTHPGAVIELDGDGADWSEVSPYPADPDDLSGPNDIIDWSLCRVAHDADSVYLSIENHEPLPSRPSWAMSCYLDSDGNRSTGFRGGGDHYPLGADLLLEGRYLYAYTGDGNNWSWAYQGRMPYGMAGSLAEFKLPRSLFTTGAIIQFLWLGKNEAYAPDGSLDQYPDAAIQYGSPGATLSYRLED